MQRVRLGRSGLHVSRICYGCWQLSPRFWGEQPEAQILSAMRRAFDLGINFFDTADAYGEGYAEQVLSKAIKELPRDQMVIATKGFWHFYDDGRRHPDLTGSYLISACEASLRRLGSDYIDLYQLHAYDHLADPADSIHALETLVKQGKVRAYGVSNWNEVQMASAQALGSRLSTLQPPYSLVKREIEERILPWCRGHDVGVLVYSPLQNGLLSGKYTGAETFTDFRKGLADFQGDRFKLICDRVAQVGAIGRRYGLTTVQTVLNVTLAHSAIQCAIVGIKTPQQIEEATGCLKATLSHEDAHKVRTLLTV